MSSFPTIQGDPPDAENLWGSVVADRASYAAVRGDVRQAIEFAHRALTYLPEDNAMMRMRYGTRTSVAGFAGLGLSKILYEQNDLPAAERYASESLDLLIRSGTTDSFGIGHALLARIRQARGDDDGALAAIRRAVQITQGFDIARVSALIGAHQARIWLAQGKLGLAARWARDYERLGETEYLREFEDLTLARVLLAQDKPSEALALLDTSLPPAEAAGRMGTVIEISALRALALRALGTADKALEPLERALQLAEPKGCARVH